jgi:hypothetical protein
LLSSFGRNRGDGKEDGYGGAGRNEIEGSDDLAGKRVLPQEHVESDGSSDPGMLLPPGNLGFQYRLWIPPIGDLAAFVERDFGLRTIGVMDAVCSHSALGETPSRRMQKGQRIGLPFDADSPDGLGKRGPGATLQDEAGLPVVGLRVDDLEGDSCKRLLSQGNMAKIILALVGPPTGMHFRGSMEIVGFGRYPVSFISRTSR